MITSVKFKNYKAFKNYSVRIDKNNIFVGKNNQGKSTIIDSFSSPKVTHYDGPKITHL